MLIRDKVGEELIKAVKNVKDKEVDIIKLDDDEEFLEAIFSKVQSELENLKITKSLDSLAEVVELIDWIQICFGSTGLQAIIDNRKEKLGLYWERYYIKDKSEEK